MEARHSPRTKSVKVFYGESSEEEKKPQPKPLPKIKSPRKHKVCRLKTPSTGPIDATFPVILFVQILQYPVVGMRNCTMSLGLNLHPLYLGNTGCHDVSLEKSHVLLVVAAATLWFIPIWSWLVLFLFLFLSSDMIFRVI